jgi:hypothetical protein
MTFKKYAGKEIQRLLKAIDANLDKKCEIILIGGAAAFWHIKRLDLL